jgi:hypothetical protein
LSASPALPRAGLDRLDLAVTVFLLAVLAAYSLAFVDLGARPEEDAAMLLRYSDHLAAGHGIVWNLGEAPVDGATDFLFMAAVAGLHALGVPLERAAQGLGLAAHAATVVLVYLAGRQLFGAPRSLAVVPAAFLLAGPGLRHLAASYGTPLFALATTVAWWWAWRTAEADIAHITRPALALAFASLVMGLARPEGVFLGAFFLLAVLLVRHARGGGRRAVAVFAGVFLTLGLAYFLWRWHYFGYPLPNPFYRKGGGVLHPHSLRMSWRDLFQLGLPFVAVLPLGLFVRTAHRAAAFTLLPTLAFTALWILISDETNYVMRFRYPLLPVVLIGFVPVWRALWTRYGRPLSPTAAAALAVAAALALGTVQHLRYRHVAPKRMGLYDAALVLREYRQRSYALVTTEAGLLPLYSTWRAVDAWGLNDAFIAHHGAVTEAYLDRYRPEVIVFHAYFSPETDPLDPRVERRSLGPAWYRMVMTLKAYADKNGYVLAAVFGRNAADTHYYYVKPGFRDSAEIASRLRDLPYFWDGEPTANFAP